MRAGNYEQALTKQGVDFDYLERLDLEAIDTDASLKNQARLLNPLEQELIDQYTSWYKEGSDGPALVVYEKKGRKRTWIIIDGNQRVTSAKKAGKKTLDAYVVKCDSQMVLDRLTWSFNNLVNGKRLSPEEALEHAKTMVQKYGMDMKAAAKEWGLSHWRVKKAVNGDKLRNILRSHNITEPCKMSDDKLEELQPFVDLGEDVFTAAASIAQRNGLTALDLKELKKNVNRAKTVEEKVRIVKTFGDTDLARQRRAETKGGTFKPVKHVLPSEKLTRLLKDLNKLQEDYTREALRDTGDRFKEQRQLAMDVVDRLILDFGLGARPPKVKEVG